MSLTTTAKNVKIGFVVFVGFIVVYLTGSLFLIPMGKNIYKSLFPPKNPPNTIFGKLEPIEFESKKLANTEPPKYTLFTPDGKLPSKIPDRMKVYKYIKPSFSYEAGKRAAEDAEKLGFTQENLVTSFKDQKYMWQDPKTRAQLSIDINNKELLLNTPEGSLVGEYREGSMNKLTAKAKAKSILQSIGRFSDPLYSKGDQTVDLGSVEMGTIVYTPYDMEAEIGYVNFFRSIGDYPIYGPEYNKGLIRMYVANKDSNKILAHPLIEYKVREIETDSKATYPIISVATAWSQVSQHNGIISYVKPNLRSPFEKYNPVQIAEILINEITLAYYDDTEEQPYLQPIYVFEGNYLGPKNEKGSIAIYYPAISGEWIKKSNTEN